MNQVYLRSCSRSQQVDARWSNGGPGSRAGLCRRVMQRVGFGAMHHLLDGHVKVFVAGSKFAIAKLLNWKPIAVRYACLKVT